MLLKIWRSTATRLSLTENIYVNKSTDLSGYTSETLVSGQGYKFR